MGQARDGCVEMWLLEWTLLGELSFEPNQAQTQSKIHKSFGTLFFNKKTPKTNFDFS
jgi:hypothetical protein